MKVAEPKVFRGVPTFFKALCHEASLGGERGYEIPGYELARHLDDLQPYGVDDDEWAEEVATLAKALGYRPDAEPGKLYRPERDDDAVWAWFQRVFPRCAALIPARRKEKFLEGVYLADENNELADAFAVLP